MRAVNLLPRESLGGTGRRVDPLVAGGAALTVVVAAAIGGGFALAHSHAAGEQQKLATARAQLARLQAQHHGSAGATAPVLPTPTVTQQQAPWQTALTSALATRVPWDAVLFQLGRVVPANVTLSTVNLGGTTSGSTTTAGSAGTLELGGTAYSEAGVAQLLSRLVLVPNLSNIVLSSSTADPKTGVVTFEVAAQLNSPMAATPPPAPTGAAS